jgi:hypothetical protein
MRGVVLAIALIFTVGFAALTIQAAARDGMNVLVGLSILVIALFAFGILGALRHPPRD